MLKALRAVVTVLVVSSFLSACVSPRIQIGRSWQEPLQEFRLEGSAKEKILVLPVVGTITAEAEKGFIRSRPGVVREIASHLEKARKDDDIRALLIIIDSPGGTAVASEMLYHELERYKEDSGAKAVALMLSVAASGGYQAALAGDMIMAHPSTVTGSVGTIFIRPKVHEFMDKIGIGAEVTTSGVHKDMGSPLRPETPQEKEIIRSMIQDMNQRFLDMVASRRNLAANDLAEVATARIYTASQAVEAGLVDEIGFREDALAKAKELAGLPDDASVVIYRRTEYPDDTVYNTVTAQAQGAPVQVGPLLPEWLHTPAAGFHYMWLPGHEEE
jgi:protease-4